MNPLREPIWDGHVASNANVPEPMPGAPLRAPHEQTRNERQTKTRPAPDASTSTPSADCSDELATTYVIV